MSAECDKDHLNWGLTFAIVAIIAFGCFVFGLSAMDDTWKKSTVKDGRARWVVVDDEGKTKWEWISK